MDYALKQPSDFRIERVEEITPEEMGYEYDPTIDKVIKIYCSKRLQGGTPVKYMYGYSAPELFDVNAYDKLMKSSISKMKGENLKINLRIDSTLNVKDLKFKGIDENNNRVVEIPLKGKDNHREKYKDSKFIYKKNINSKQHMISHTMEVVNPTIEYYSFEWKWKKM